MLGRFAKTIKDFVQGSSPASRYAPTEQTPAAAAPISDKASSNKETVSADSTQKNTAAASQPEAKGQPPSNTAPTSTTPQVETGKPNEADNKAKKEPAKFHADTLNGQFSAFKQSLSESVGQGKGKAMQFFSQFAGLEGLANKSKVGFSAVSMAINKHKIDKFLDKQIKACQDLKSNGPDDSLDTKMKEFMKAKEELGKVYSEAFNNKPPKTVLSNSQEEANAKQNESNQTEAAKEEVKRKKQNEAANAGPGPEPLPKDAPALSGGKIDLDAVQEGMKAKVIEESGKAELSADKKEVNFSFPTSEDKSKLNFSFSVSEKGAVATAPFPSDPVEKEKAMDLMCDAALKGMSKDTKTFNVGADTPDNEKLLCESLAKQMEAKGGYSSDCTINNKPFGEFLNKSADKGMDSAITAGASAMKLG